MLCAFGHRVATCCMGAVSSSLKVVKFEPTCCNRMARNMVRPTICWVGILRSFGRGFNLYTRTCFERESHSNSRKPTVSVCQWTLPLEFTRQLTFLLVVRLVAGIPRRLETQPDWNDCLGRLSVWNQPSGYFTNIHTKLMKIKEAEDTPQSPSKWGKCFRMLRWNRWSQLKKKMSWQRREGEH